MDPGIVKTSHKRPMIRKPGHISFIGKYIPRGWSQSTKRMILGRSRKRKLWDAFRDRIKYPSAKLRKLNPVDLNELLHDIGNLRLRGGRSDSDDVPDLRKLNLSFGSRRGSRRVRRGSRRVRRGSRRVRRGSSKVRRGSRRVRRGSSKVRRGSSKVRRGTRKFGDEPAFIPFGNDDVEEVHTTGTPAGIEERKRTQRKNNRKPR
jgi:hypothetical protein